MKLSVASSTPSPSPSSSRARARAPMKDRLEEFARLMGTTVSVSSPLDGSGSSNDTSSEENPKSRRLDLLLSTHEERWAATFPSLSLFPPPKNNANAAITAPSDPRSAARLAETCLSRPVRYDNLAEISTAPEAAARSAAETFRSLVYANLRSFARMRDIQNSWGPESARTSERFRRRISDKDLVRVCRVSSKFSTSPVEANDATEGCDRSCHLGLNANFSLDVNIGGISDCISVDATGHITGCYAAPGESSTSTTTTQNNSIDVQLDCAALLMSLRRQARLVAYNFVTRNVSASVLQRATNTGTAAKVSSDDDDSSRSSSSQKAVQVVTPSSSPLLSILSAAAATLMEPMTLDESAAAPAPKRRLGVAAPTAERGRTLPPKKRLRRAVTPPAVL